MANRVKTVVQIKLCKESCVKKVSLRTKNHLAGGANTYVKLELNNILVYLKSPRRKREQI